MKPDTGERGHDPADAGIPGRRPRRKRRSSSSSAPEGLAEGQDGFFSRLDDQPLLSDKAGLERVGQGVIPGAEATTKPAAAPVKKERKEQKGTTGLALFDNVEKGKQGSLFSRRDAAAANADLKANSSLTDEQRSGRQRLYTHTQNIMRFLAAAESRLKLFSQHTGQQQAGRRPLFAPSAGVHLFEAGPA